MRHLLANLCTKLSFDFFSLLGSLSSSHASSKGSLSSLSFTDIYGLSTTASATANSAADLQKKFLQQPRGHSVGVSAGEPRNENHRNVLDLSSSQQSLSPHRQVKLLVQNFTTRWRLLISKLIITGSPWWDLYFKLLGQCNLRMACG